MELHKHSRWGFLISVLAALCLPLHAVAAATMTIHCPSKSLPSDGVMAISIENHPGCELQRSDGNDGTGALSACSQGQSSPCSACGTCGLVSLGAMLVAVEPATALLTAVERLTFRHALFQSRSIAPLPEPPRPVPV